MHDDDPISELHCCQVGRQGEPEQGDRGTRRAKAGSRRKSAREGARIGGGRQWVLGHPMAALVALPMLQVIPSHGVLLNE